MIDISFYEDLGINYFHQFTKGEEVKVAVMDSFIKVDHPEFVGKEIEQYSYIDSNKENYHGTAVSSLIVGNTLGIAPLADLIHYEMLSDAYGTGRSWDKSISSATRNNVDVLCMSIGTKSILSLSMEQALYNLKVKGTIICAPAGNEGKVVIREPANNKNVLSVGGTDGNGNISSISNRSIDLNLLAPCENIKVANIDDELYFYKTGTSFANAIMVGQIALIKSYIKKYQIKTDVYEVLRSYRVKYSNRNKEIDMRLIKKELDLYS